MSAELYLQRFDPSSNDGPVRPGILSEMTSLVRQVLADEGREDIQLNADDEVVTIGLDGGVAELHPTYGSIPMKALDQIGIRIVFEIAREGDMVIVLEGGRYRAILMNSNQWESLPPEWIEKRDEAPVCGSPAELRALLGEWIGLHGSYIDQMGNDVEPPPGTNSAEPIPGTKRDPQNDFIYIEARSDDTALRHLKSVEKWYRAAVKSGVGLFPTSGLMGATRWRLELPNGKAFFALSVSGDREGWVSALSGCASAAGRSVGRIIRGETFLLDDGQSIPLSACRCVKAKE